jgi:hypothetical protein
MFNQSTGAAHAVVAAVAATQLKLLGLTLTSAGDCVVTIEDSDGTDLVGAQQLIKGVPWVLPISEVGWAKPAVGKGISVLLASGVQVGGALVIGSDP